jgi:hypothetical protein
VLLGKHAAHDAFGSSSLGLPHLQAEVFWNIGPLSTMLENHG